MSIKYISQDALINLSSALAQVGCTADQMTEALRNISDLMAQVAWASDEITAIKDSLSDMRYDMECQDASLQCQIDVLDMKLDELRPATDEKTENPKQKSDLEIFSRIEENPYVSSFIDLDSEGFLNQRPLWDFTVDF